MLCKNGLHEIDPDDTWQASNGARCRPCHLARQARYDKSPRRRKVERMQTLKGNRAAGKARRDACRTPEQKRADRRVGYERERKDPVYRQMHNDSRRLGISRAEWRRQVAQGIIEVPTRR